MVAPFVDPLWFCCLISQLLMKDLTMQFFLVLFDIVLFSIVAGCGSVAMSALVDQLFA